jgi:hypothetical protein
MDWHKRAVGTMEELDARCNAELRSANGLVDEVVFSRLRSLGVAESDLHAFAMRLVRTVQAGKDADGAIAALLGVTRAGVNGTVRRPA